MIVGSIIEDRKIESRVALTPENVKKFLGLGFKVLIEKNYALSEAAEVLEKILARGAKGKIILKP